MSTLSPPLRQASWMPLCVLLLLLLAQENAASLKEQPAEEVGLEGGSFGRNPGQLFHKQTGDHPASPGTIPLTFMRLASSNKASLSDQADHLPRNNVSIIHRVLTVVAFLLAILLLCYAFQPSNASESDRAPSVAAPDLVLDAPYMPTDASKANNKEAASASEGVGIKVHAGRKSEVPPAAIREEEGTDAAILAAAGAYLYFKLELLANYCQVLLPSLPDSLQPSILRSTIVFGMQELSILSVLFAGEFQEDRGRTFDAFVRLKDQASRRLSDWQLKDTSIPALSAMLDQLRQLDVRPISAVGHRLRLLEFFVPSSEQAIIQVFSELKTLMGCVRRTGNVDEDVSSSVQSVLAAVRAERLQHILEAPGMSAPLVACYQRLPLESGTFEKERPSMQTERSADTEVVEFGQHHSSVWTVPAKSQQRTAIAPSGLKPKVQEPLVQKDDVEEVLQLQAPGVPPVAAEAGMLQSSTPPQTASEEPPHFLMRPIEPASQVSQKNPIQIVRPTPIYARRHGVGLSMTEAPEEDVPRL